MITNLWDLATLERPSRLPCERSMPPVCWFGKIISTLFLKNKNHEKLQRPTYVSSNVNVWHFSMQLLTFNSFAFACKCIDISFVGTCFCWHLYCKYLYLLSLLFFIFAFSCQLATASMQGNLSDAWYWTPRFEIKEHIAISSSSPLRPWTRTLTHLWSFPYLLIISPLIIITIKKVMVFSLSSSYVTSHHHLHI